MRVAGSRRVLAAVLVAVLGFVALAVSGSPARAADVPYTDPNASGAIGFCDAQGHEVKGGKLDATPFVAFTVGNFRPPAPYDTPGTGAWLIAYQPRKGVDPGNWSGEQLTASSTYTKPDFPKIEMLAQDVTMRQIVEDYPPQWDGLLQLRMYVKAVNQPAYSARYPAADIRISGDSWNLVRGGGVSCTASGTATSRAHLLIPTQLTSSPASLSGGSRTPPATGTESSGDTGDHPQTRASSRSGSSVSTRSAWLVPVALIALGGASWAGVVALRKQGRLRHR